jgi:hypothetical protein
MSDRVSEHAEVVAATFEGLCAQLQHCCFRRVQVFDTDVDVRLLSVVLRRPGRRPVRRNLLEGQPGTVRGVADDRPSAPSSPLATAVGRSTFRSNSRAPRASADNGEGPGQFPDQGLPGKGE